MMQADVLCDAVRNQNTDCDRSRPPPVGASFRREARFSPLTLLPGERRPRLAGALCGAKSHAVGEGRVLAPKLFEQSRSQHVPLA